MRSLFDRMLIDPFHRLADQCAHLVPALIVVLVTLVVGGFLAFVLRWLTFRLLELARFDRLVQRTGFASMPPTLSPSAVMSSRARANPGGLRFAGRRRNMPSKSTIPASLSLSR